ncbi:MAG: MotA/TolQ/ExbB proton channel family protein [Phycisphaerae bacterium]|nr:MotA/TolQ/ExbB proton channel family protein [Phycisphaerae bacterium]
MGIEWFKVFFVHCGGIGWLLWLVSVATLAIIVEHFISIRRANILPDEVHQQIQNYFEERNYREAIEVTAEEPSQLSYMIHAALSEASHGYAAMERAMEEASEERTTKLLRHIEWLNLIGNVAPMLGLFGTVWGMIKAFFQIVDVDGQADPSKLAGGIGTALMTTLLGLAVAIPSLAVYALMRNRIDALSSEAMLASQDLISNFRPGAKQQ